MKQEEGTQVQETQADWLAGYLKKLPSRDLVFRAFIIIAAAAIVIAVLWVSIATARAPSDGTSGSTDCRNVVSMVETLPPDCATK